MSDKDLLQQLRDLVNSDTLTADWERTVKGNLTAGTRVRSVMQEVRQLGKSIRDEVINLRKKTKEEKKTKAQAK